MLSSEPINHMTPEQKVDFFCREYAKHYAEYSAEIDPRTGECDFSLPFIFDVFLEYVRLTYGTSNLYYATNAARIVMDRVEMAAC